jgi:hypothetical protein
MPAILDILALEPFYGVERRIMLESMIRCSRHRWSLHTLPPRRIERRLTTAAHWFKEQLARHMSGNVDIVIASEALNLVDLIRLVPELADKKLVVYFHSNQLPHPDAIGDNALDLVNLNSAMAAHDIWFNSEFHIKTFLYRAAVLVDRYPELKSRNPMPALGEKSFLMFPPIGLDLLRQVPDAAVREPRSIYVDTRDADLAVLNDTLDELMRQGEALSLHVIGPTTGLDPLIPVTSVSQTNIPAQFQAMRQSDIVLSIKPDVMFDPQLLLAVAAGCWPIVPGEGVYKELIPETLHDESHYRYGLEGLLARLTEAFHNPRPESLEYAFQEILGRYETIPACRQADTRFDELAAGK